MESRHGVVTIARKIVVDFDGLVVSDKPLFNILTELEISVSDGPQRDKIKEEG